MDKMSDVELLLILGFYYIDIYVYILFMLILFAVIDAETQEERAGVVRRVKLRDERHVVRVEMQSARPVLVCAVALVFGILREVESLGAFSSPYSISV